MNTYIKYSDILLNPFSKSIEGEIRLKFYSKVRSENFPNLLWSKYLSNPNNWTCSIRNLPRIVIILLLLLKVFCIFKLTS